MDHHQGALSFLHWDPVCKASHWQSQVPLTFIEHHLGDIDHSVETFKRHCEKSFFLHEKIHETGGNWSLGWRERGARGWVCSGCHLCPSINHPWPRGELWWAGGHREGEHCNLGKPGAWTGGLPGEIGKLLFWCNMIPVLVMVVDHCLFQSKGAISSIYICFFSQQVINVYAPDLKTQRPVMVFVHGGGFFAGPNILIQTRSFIFLWNISLKIYEMKIYGITRVWHKRSVWARLSGGRRGRAGYSELQVVMDMVWRTRRLIMMRSIKKFAIKVIFQGWGLWGFWV